MVDAQHVPGDRRGNTYEVAVRRIPSCVLPTSVDVSSGAEPYSMRIFSGACAAVHPHECLGMPIGRKLLRCAARKAFDHKTIIAPLPTRGAVDRPIERHRPKSRIAQQGPRDI